MLVEPPTNRVSERIIGAAIEVHRYLGPGLLESSYHACLSREMDVRGIAFRSRVSLPLHYKGTQVAKGYVVDTVVEDSVIIEIKAVDRLLPIHGSQLMTYLRLCNLHTGILINFNVDILTRGVRRLLR